MQNQLLLRKYYLLERLKEGGYPGMQELIEYVSLNLGKGFDHIRISERVIERDIEFLKSRLFQSIQFDQHKQGYIYNESESPVTDLLSNFFLIAGGNGSTPASELKKVG